MFQKLVAVQNPTLGKRTEVSKCGKWKWVKDNLSPPIEKSAVAGLLISIGLMIGAGFLITHSGALPSWVHAAAIGGTVYFSASTAIGIVYTADKYRKRAQYRKKYPNLYLDHS
ncbi:MAG: hypothetical protein JJU12_05995 [Chlamydiales bacterium]|nr:hypothetical protein [Chlamydiales bacterium]